MSPVNPQAPASTGHHDCDRPPRSLVVFSDDWGRHPSSCQHLIRCLLPDYRVLWVNTIGTRAPGLNLMTLRRVAEKCRQWVRTNTPSDGNRPDTQHNFHPHLTVTNPRMWPWFGRAVDRRFNAWLLQRQLTSLIEALPQPVSALTTLPITADLPGRLPVDRWLYYCVDDFSAWPGLDGSTLRRMDRDMVREAGEIVAVSPYLQRMIGKFGRNSSLLTHGVNLKHWQEAATAGAERPAALAAIPSNRRLAVFWGVVDRRLDTAMLTALSDSFDGSIVLIGPQQDPDPKILNLPNVVATGPQPFEDLPSIAAHADALIMPYANLPVTQAMQPLKLKEYLATGRPVVVSRLPAVADWLDCLDVADCPAAFCQAICERIRTGLPESQRIARRRLQQESWEAKAKELQHYLNRPPACDQISPVAEGTHHV